MPVKTGRKLPRARVDAKVAQAAVRLARHVPAAPSTPPARRGAEAATDAASSSAVRLALHPSPAPRSPEAQAHSAEVADLLERLAADATPRRREEINQHVEKLTTDVITHEPRPPLPQSHPDVVAWRKRRSARTRLLQRQAKLTKSYREELRLAATGGDNKWDCCDCANLCENQIPDALTSTCRRGQGRLRAALLGRDGQRRPGHVHELHDVPVPPGQRLHERQFYLSYFWQRRVSLF